MRGLYYDKGISYRVDLPEPAPRDGEALLKVSLAGICQTDLEIFKGYMGFKGVPGHEFVALVLTPGDLQGKRVVGEINCPCGGCSLCADGLGNHCRHRSVLGIAGRDGCFAEFITLPIENLHPLPHGLSDEEALFVEPLAAAFQIAKQVSLTGGEKCLVLGGGRLGLLVAQVLKNRCGTLLLVDPNPMKRNLAENLGIRAGGNWRDGPEDGADIVVDATGSVEGLQSALRAVRPRGTVVLKTTVATPYKIDLAPVVINEIKLVGSRCGPFPEALTALANGEVDVKGMLSASFPLSQFEKAVHVAAGPKGVKVAFKL